MPERHMDLMNQQGVWVRTKKVCGQEYDRRLREARAILWRTSTAQRT